MNQELELSEKLMNEGFTPFGEIDELTKDKILGREVFEYIFSIDNSIAKTELIIKLEDKARELGIIRSFDKLLKAYQTEFAQRYKQKGSNIIHFTQPPIEGLKCGKWECEDSGVTKSTMGAGMIPQTIIACPHPILPVERLINVDSETEKIKLAFFKDDKWQYITIERSMVANKSNIIQLSDRGVEVNSENAKDLVSYIADVVSLNAKEIPVSRSTDRLGWIENEFAPYVENLKYDGDMAFKDVYASIKGIGKYEDWKDVCRKVRKQSKIAHILLAASFASTLNQKLGVLPFVVHIWGGTGAGKTVGLMLAMSIWGNPEVGKMVRTLNATQVALARYAAFVHDIPFAGDELQTIKNRWDSFDNLVMYLTEGVDRGRGKAYGGIEILKEWNCCFLFTGEEPITKATSGGGVKNRVIEIEATEKVIEDGNYISNFVRKNYGFAGKDFIKNLPGQEELQQRYREIFKKILEKTDTTDKQAMAMATILLADEISTNLIFKDEKLNIDDVKNWLTSSKEVDVSTRAYEWTMNWISQNINRFKENENGEIWGKYIENEDLCLVNKSVYTEALNKAGFDFNAVIRNFADRNQIERNSQGKFTHFTKAFGIKGAYIKFRLEPEKSDIAYEENYEQSNLEDLPF
ncbi:MAG: DUF927 domain-containing protein [Clostridium sp.]|nr:DUF927 domain-containing protein [Clostridium sp.]